jgi:Cellulase (glycosyl hydrolase family 5)
MRPRIGPRPAAVALVVAVALTACGGSGAPRPTPQRSSAGPGAVPAGASVAPSTSGPAPGASATIGPEVFRISGWLHTDGAAIVDGHGNRVRLLAIGLPGMEQGEGNRREEGGRCGGWRVPAPAAYRDIPTWGFNAVRVPVSWANLEPAPPTAGPGGDPVHHYADRYLRAIDQIVDGFASRGVAVVLDMHQVRWSPAFRDLHLGIGVTIGCGTGMPAWLYPSGGGVPEMVAAERAFFAGPEPWRGLIDAWTMLARRYADNPMVVGADILNEAYDPLAERYPGTEGLTPAAFGLSRFYTAVGSAIHAANPHLLVVFEENRSKSTGLWALTERPRIPNAVMSVHFYGKTWDDPVRGRPLLERYYRRSAEWKLPLWIGESTVFYYTTPFPHDPNWEQDLRRMLAYCRERHIGWTIWAYNRGRFLEQDSDAPKPGIVPVLLAGR